MRVASRIASRVLCGVHYAPCFTSFAPRVLLRSTRIAFLASRHRRLIPRSKVTEIESKLLIRLRYRWETGSSDEVGKK